MKSTCIMLMAMLIGLMPIASFSAPEPSNPKQQTSWKLYVDSKEAYVMKQEM